jgi:biopolymer transport protein ExbB
MDNQYTIAPLLDAAAYGIYTALALTALYGAFCVILLVRRIAQKRFMTTSAADQFLDEIRGLVRQRNFEAIVEMCDSPPYWSKATPQLMLVALDNRDVPLAKLRRRLAEKFERDVLADLEYRASWISTLVKSAPMLGLLGTVTGMISAFAKMESMAQAGTDPGQLAGDISFALFTTALGLSVAIPLVLAGAMIHVRIGKLQDAVQQQIGEFLDEYETVAAGTKG